MKKKLSHITIIKFHNKELSPEKMRRVKKIIDNSPEYSRKLNELKEIYSLVNIPEKIEDNPNLYINIINKLTANEEQNHQYEPNLKPAFQTVLATLLILITIYTGINLGETYVETNENKFLSKQGTEIFFNDLQLEKIENILLTEN